MNFDASAQLFQSPLPMPTPMLPPTPAPDNSAVQRYGPPGYTSVGPGPGHGQAVAAFVHALNAARQGDRSLPAQAAMQAAHDAGLGGPVPVDPRMIAHQHLHSQLSGRPDLQSLLAVLAG